VTTQYTPFELVYDTQLVMPAKFAVPTKNYRPSIEIVSSGGACQKRRILSFPRRRAKRL